MRLTTRIKRSKQMIRLVRPFDLTSNDLIYPIFIREDGKTFEIPSMKGQRYYSLDDCHQVCSRVVDLEIPAVMVFGLIEGKDVDGSVALRRDGFHSRIFSKLKKEFGDDLKAAKSIAKLMFKNEKNMETICRLAAEDKEVNEITYKMIAGLDTYKNLRRALIKRIGLKHTRDGLSLYM